MRSGIEITGEIKKMCATEYALGMHCGVTFAGMKPSSLLSLRKSELEKLDFFAGCFAQKGFRFVNLRDGGDRVLVLVFSEKDLSALLTEKRNAEFLESLGYFYQNAGQALDILKGRLSGEDFPHEIGIFLGYPLEDVRGFIKSPTEGVMISGYWKVYEDAENKAKLFKRFDVCSRLICQKLSRGETLTEIFGVGYNG